MNFFSKWFTKSNNKKDVKFRDIQEEMANDPELKKLGESMQLVAMGIMLGQSGNFDGAIETLKEAIRAYPNTCYTI